MRFPDVPFKINEYLGLDVIILLHNNRFDFKQSIKVFTLIVVTIKSIVVFLRIELNYG